MSEAHFSFPESQSLLRRRSYGSRPHARPPDIAAFQDQAGGATIRPCPRSAPTGSNSVSRRLRSRWPRSRLICGIEHFRRSCRKPWAPETAKAS